MGNSRPKSVQKCRNDMCWFIYFFYILFLFAFVDVPGQPFEIGKDNCKVPASLLVVIVLNCIHMSEAKQLHS